MTRIPLTSNLRVFQCTQLAVQFLEGSWSPQATWTLIGVALRLAQVCIFIQVIHLSFPLIAGLQDVGVHRRMARVEQPSVERELWKRAFWVLVHMDRTVSSNMGRPCALQYDE